MVTDKLQNSNSKPSTWQRRALEGANLIRFFIKKRIKFAPSKKSIFFLPMD